MSTIPFIRVFDFQYETLEQLTPNLARIVCKNPGPFTYTGTNVFIVGQGKDVAIVDPGPIDETHRAAIDKALVGKNLSHIFLTHHHSDHSPLARELARDYGSKIFGLSRPKNCNAGGEIKLDAGNDHSFKIDHDIHDGEVFSANGWTIRAIHTPGHCANHVCYNFVEQDALFCGDHIMGWATSVVIPPDGHMGDYLQSLETIRAMNFSTLYPTHGAQIENVQTFISAYIEHRLSREREVLKAVRAGHSDILDIVKSIYTDLDTRLHPAAALSVLSHLIWLGEKGLVGSDHPPSLQAKFYPGS